MGSIMETGQRNITGHDLSRYSDSDYQILSSSDNRNRSPASYHESINRMLSGNYKEEKVFDQVFHHINHSDGRSTRSDPSFGHLLVMEMGRVWQFDICIPVVRVQIDPWQETIRRSDGDDRNKYMG